MEEQVLDKQMENDKISKQFDTHFKKLVALLGGEKNFKKPKVKGDQVGFIIADLMQERREKAIELFKTKAIEILDKKMEFDKEIKKAEEEFKKSVLNKKKEFSERMKEVFALVENIDEVEKAFYDSLKEVSEEK